jgi:class 3 adenylate cyclase
MVRDRFLADPRPLAHAEAESFEAAVAFVDISGFTKLSERLVKEFGNNGAEKLNKVLSRCRVRAPHATDSVLRAVHLGLL